MGWPNCGDQASNVAPDGTETTPSFTGNTSFVFMGCAQGTHTLSLLTKVGSKELATVSIGVNMPPTPTNTPVTPEPTPVPTTPPTPVSAYATISLSDDDVTVSYGWSNGGGGTKSTESWTITLRQSATQNGTYTNYRSASSPAAGAANFNSVQRSRWYMARVSGCDEQSNCSSADSGKIWVPPPPSGDLSVSASPITQYSAFKVSAANVSPSNLSVKIKYQYPARL